MSSTAPPLHNGDSQPSSDPTLPMHGAAPLGVPPPMGKGHWYRRGWVIAVIALLVGLGLGAAASTKPKPKIATVTAPAQTVTNTVSGPTETTTVVRKVPGPTVTVTHAQVTPAGGGSGGGGPAGAQHFSGTNQQNLGTIHVPTDSTISWSCSGCGGTNFIINNASGDAGTITTNGLNQTNGVDPLTAGDYHTVVVNTDGGPWTVDITPG